MNIPWGRIKPGWYVLALLLCYAVWVTTALQRSNAALEDLRAQASAEVVLAGDAETPPSSDEPATPPPATAPAGLWFPVPGSSLPETTAYLPGVPRDYRKGVNQGFDFYSGDTGIPIPYGTPVIASATGVVIRADVAYQELAADEWQALLDAVAVTGATEEQLDRLRGRQVWLRTDDGLILRYAHLSGVRPGLEPGQRVYRGQVIGYVGNSGTDDGVAGGTAGARLHYEIWYPDGTFFGQGLDPKSLRLKAASLFVGP